MLIVFWSMLPITAFRADTRGVTAVEYGLIAAFMAAALVIAVPLLTGALNGSFTTIAGHVTTGS